MDKRAKELFGELTEEVKKSIVQLYNINRGNGEDKAVTLHAAEQVKQIAEHAANFAAFKILEELEQEKKRREREEQEEAEGLLALFAALAMALGGGRDSGGNNASKVGAADHSSNKIKYPVTMEEELGHGAFGVVYRAKGSDGFRFAVKEVKSGGKEADSLRHEIQCLIGLSHRNIVTCFGFAEGGGKILMYMELLSGSIADKMKNAANRACTEPEARKYTADSIKGLMYLHHNEIVHRDIKCANVLLDSSGTAKLGDMGLSKQHVQQTMSSYGGSAGSFYWMSPESLTAKLIGKRPDIWKPPLFELNVIDFLLVQTTAAQDGCSRHRQAVMNDQTFTGDLQDFLLQIFVPCEKRPFINTVASHSWNS